MVDPGAVSADLMKANGFVTTKSKMCGEAYFKLAFEEYKKAGLENTFPIRGTDKKFSAQCDGTAKPPVSCTSDTDCEKDFKGGCCAMVDPGTVPAGLLQARGFPTTKSKMCTDVLRKT